MIFNAYNTLIYSLHIVKEVVSDIDTVSKNNFHHYLFAKFFLLNIVNIHFFLKLYFKMNLLKWLSYFQTQLKRIYL